MKASKNGLISQANRGMDFEQLIDHCNRMYERLGIAIINKRPTPIRITGRLSGGKVTGFFEKPSTVDYDGTYRGRSIVFEAKSTKELHRFPLNNLEAHQFEYMEKCHTFGNAIAFVLIEFEAHRTVYLMPFITLKHFWQGTTKNGRGKGSIPLSALDVNAWEVGPGKVPIDYLAVVDKVWRLDAA